tara:strand:+ start:8215 stop:9525 length:1311 start_codon:yes stop_codon:yes gene_type:complete
MTITSSGQVSLNDLHVEVGGTSGTQVSMNDADIRSLGRHQNCTSAGHHQGGDRGIAGSTIPINEFYNTTWANDGHIGNAPYYSDITNPTVSTSQGWYNWYNWYTNSFPSGTTHISLLVVGPGGGAAGTGSNQGGAGGHGGGTFWMYGFPIEGLPGGYAGNWSVVFQFVLGRVASGRNKDTNGINAGWAGFGAFNNSTGTYTLIGGVTGAGGGRKSNPHNQGYQGSPGAPYFDHGACQTYLGDRRPLAMNGSRGGYGGPTASNSAGGGGGGAGGWPNTNNVVADFDTYPGRGFPTTGIQTFTAHNGGGNGRANNGNGYYVNLYAASRSTGFEYGGGGGRGGTSYRRGGGGTHPDGRTGTETAASNNNIAEGGSNGDNGQTANGASHGGNYGGGGAADDDDYVGNGGNGGQGILRIWFHNARLSEAWPSTGALYTNTL